MAAAGCRTLFIGFETVSEAGLLQCRKVQNRAEEYDQTIALLHRHGIMANASLAFGFDSDHESVFARTLEWLGRLAGMRPLAEFARRLAYPPGSANSGARLATTWDRGHLPESSTNR